MFENSRDGVNLLQYPTMMWLMWHKLFLRIKTYGLCDKFPSTQPNQYAHNQASHSTQPGTEAWLCASFFGNIAVADEGSCFNKYSYLHDILHTIW